MVIGILLEIVKEPEQENKQEHSVVAILKFKALLAWKWNFLKREGCEPTELFSQSQRKVFSLFSFIKPQMSNVQIGSINLNETQWYDWFERGTHNIVQKGWLRKSFRSKHQKLLVYKKWHKKLSPTPFYSFFLESNHLWPIRG